MNQLNALILCGGKSSRLGFDKLTILKEGVTLAQWWQRNLRPYCNEVYYSCNEELRSKYNLNPCIIDEDLNQGPLGGICSYISTHSHLPVLIVAVDLVFLEVNSIVQLISERDQFKNASCYVDFSGNIFPLFTILETSIFDNCRQEYNSDRKSLYSLLQKSECNIISKLENFNGINTPIDYYAYLELQREK